MNWWSRRSSRSPNSGRDSMPYSGHYSDREHLCIILHRILCLIPDIILIGNISTLFCTLFHMNGLYSVLYSSGHYSVRSSAPG